MRPDDLRKTILVWAGRSSFEVPMTDDIAIRAYDAFSNLDEEHLAQVRANFDEMIASLGGTTTGTPPLPCPPPREEVNGECVDPCPQGQTREAGVCACRSPNEMVNGVCRHPCVVGQGRNAQGECEGPAEAVPPPHPCPTDQNWDAAAAKCVCNAPMVNNAMGACVYPPEPPPINDGQGACLASGGQWVNNQCTHPPTAITAEQLAAEKRSSMIKGALAGAGAVGLGVLIYELLF
jgi:hypothetical protein